MLRELNVNCVLDVGANEGQYGQRLREAGYAGRIVSFEPLEVHVAPLRERAAADHNWKVFACALGDSDGEAEINVAPGKVVRCFRRASLGETGRTTCATLIRRRSRSVGWTGCSTRRPRASRIRASI